MPESSGDETEETGCFYRRLHKATEFTFGDLNNYLVGKDDYSPENLRWFKSPLGFKLFRDDHVDHLKHCPVEGKSFCFFQFKVKPTKKG